MPLLLVTSSDGLQPMSGDDLGVWAEMYPPRVLKRG